MSTMKASLLVILALTLGACTQGVKPPSEEDRKAIRKAQTDIWKGTTEAKKKRIP
jgi:hypothetical protein